MFEEQIGAFEENTPAAFVESMQSFLRALDYDDIALMRSHLVAAREALGNALSDAVRKRVAWSESGRRFCDRVMKEIEGYAFEFPNSQLDEIGRGIETSLDHLLEVLTDSWEQLIHPLLEQNVNIANAESLQNEIVEVKLRKQSILVDWPWSNRPGPSVNRTMLSDSRAARERGDHGENLAELLKHLRSESS